MKKRPSTPQANNKLRIAAYIRVSSQRQVTEGDSLEAQQHEITRYIDIKKSLQGWEVDTLEFYIDAGRSAKDQNRPQLLRLKRDTAAGRIDLVVCFKLDRITRSLLDFVELWTLFNQHRVRVVSLREDFDTTSVMGEAMLKLIMVFAELERKLTAERTIAIMRDRVERKLWNGGHVYGYLSDPAEKGKLIRDPEWAPIIKTHFFEAFLTLGSAGAVLRELNKLGIRLPVRKTRAGKIRGGQPFAKQQVIRVLRNHIYIGRLTWGQATQEDCHEPIISRELFDDVQRLLDQTTKKRANHRYSRGRSYVLAGLVRCACGMMMTPKGATGRSGTYHYYECTRQIHHGRAACDAPRIPAEAIDKAVIDRIIEISSRTEARDQIVQEALKALGDDARQVEAEMITVRHRIGTVQKEIQNLVGVLKHLGEHGVETVKNELDSLADEQAMLQGRLEELAKRGTPLEQLNSATRSFVETWASVAELLKLAEPEERQVILRHYVEVLELRAQVGKKVGSYVLRLFPEAATDGNDQSDEQGDDEEGGGVPATPPPQKPSGGEGLTFSPAGSQRDRKSSPTRTRT